MKELLNLSVLAGALSFVSAVTSAVIGFKTIKEQNNATDSVRRVAEYIVVKVKKNDEIIRYRIPLSKINNNSVMVDKPTPNDIVRIATSNHNRPVLVSYNYKTKRALKPKVQQQRQKGTISIDSIME